MFCLTANCQIDNPYWSWEEEATYVDADEDYNVPYAITVRFSELRPVLNNPHMDKETLIKCIELIDCKYKYYYEEAKKVGQLDAAKEKEYVSTAIALKDLKDELLEMLQQP